MHKAAVRRVNEWDGPAMLKIYAPYTGTCHAPEQEVPSLQSYIQRIDRYTYGLGWILCEIDSTPAGFCHLREWREAPKDLFCTELELYVKEEFQRRRVGCALWELMRDMMELGNRKRVVSYIHRENEEALRFFEAMGFFREREGSGELVCFSFSLKPRDPEAQLPTKPYLIENLDYEAAREKAAKGILQEK